MSLWQRQSLALLLLTLVVCSSLLNVLAGATSRTEAETPSPFVLVEALEEGGAEESGEFVPLVDVQPCLMACEISYAAHIAEECEYRRAKQCKSHFWRGPPTV